MALGNARDQREDMALWLALQVMMTDDVALADAVLVDRLHAAGVVVGENFRFGHKAAGDVALLAELGAKYDFTAEGVPLLSDAGETISSSEIRGMLAAGDVEAAALWPEH